METSESRAPTIEASVPAPLYYASVSHASKVAGEITKYSFSIRIAHSLPPGSFLRVKWPQQIQLDRQEIECSISTRPEGIKKCRMESASVYFYEINDETLQEGKSIQFSIFGLKNSLFADPTDSFVITTLSDKFTEVDWQNEGLTVENTCDWPCLSCREEDKSQCLSCQQTSPFFIFHEAQQSCVDYCPTTFYQANRRCNKCDASCYDCADNAKQCTSCKPGTYLLGNACVEKCPYNSLTNEVSRLCVMCETPCDTCEFNVDKCTSCLSNIRERYFWKGKCRTQCPKDITVFSDGLCTPCDDNCKTCEFQTDVCTSCNRPQLLDQADHTCKDSCPVGISVTRGDQCIACNNICETCAGDDPDKCLTCKKGLSFVEWESTCVPQCPVGSTLQFEDSQQKCKQCDEGCAECAGSPNYCTRCDEDHLFYKFTCLDSCPAEFKRMDFETNVCIPEREKCRYGYAYNQYGECQIINVLCEDGTQLNESLNKCLPRPTLTLPFLFLGLAFMWALVVVIWGRQKPMIPQLLLGWNAILQSSSFLLIYLYDQIGLLMVSKINTLVIMFIIFENVMMTLWVMNKSQRHDKAFGHWCTYNQSVSTIFLTITTWWSFKMVRCYYSKLFGKKSFSAAFDQKFETIVKPLFAISIVHFTLFQVPMMFTDVYTLMTFGPEFEITTCALDNLVLSLVIFVLEIFEYKSFLKPEIDELLPTFKRMKGKQYLVKNSIIEDEADFSKIVDNSLMPLNVLENADFPKSEKKNQMAWALRLQSQKKLRETELLEGLCRRLEQKQKFLQMANQDNLPHNFLQNMHNPHNKHHIHRQKLLKAQKERFVLKKTFVIREKKKDFLTLINNLDDHDIRTYKQHVHLEEKAQKRVISAKVKDGRIRLNQSFDADILREDQMGEGLSDNESAYTFPLMADDHRIDLSDPREIADLEIFREKLKSKFHYDNCYTEKIPAKVKPKGPMYKDTQTQLLGTIDPFELSEAEQVSVASEGLIGDELARGFIQTVIGDGVSEESERQQEMEKFKKDSLKFEKAIKMRSDQVPLSEKLETIDQSQKDPEASSSIYRPVNPQDIISSKMREQEAQMNQEMRALGINEDFLVDEEHKQVQSEYEKLKELSLGKPSDDQSLDLDYDNKSVKSQADIFQLTAIQKVTKKMKNKRQQRLERAYGKKNNSNFDLLSTSKKPQKSMLEVFPELVMQESQMINTERRSHKSGISTMSSKIIQSQDLRLKSKRSESDLGAQLGQILQKRQENRQKILNLGKNDDLEFEIDQVMNGSPNYKKLFSEINQPSTAKKSPPKPQKFDKFKHMIYENIIDQKQKFDTNQVLKSKINENIQYEKSIQPKPFDPKNLLNKKGQKVQKHTVNQSVNKLEQVRSIYDNQQSQMRSVMSDGLRRSSSAVGELRSIKRHNYVESGISKIGLELSKMESADVQSIRSSSQHVRRLNNFYLSESKSGWSSGGSSEPEKGLISGMQHTLNIMALQRQKARKQNAELILKGK